MFLAILCQRIERISEATLPNELQGCPSHPIQDFDLGSKKVSNANLGSDS